MKLRTFVPFILPIIVIIIALIISLCFGVVQTDDKKAEKSVTTSETMQLVEKLPFQYRMVKVKNEINDNDKGMENIFIIEILNNEYKIVDVTFQNSAGVDVETSNYKTEIVTNVGKVCTNSLIEHLVDGETKSQTCDRYVYVIRLKTNDKKLLKEELKMNVTTHNEKLNKNEIVVLKENCKLSDITATHGYITGNTLVELDESYYVSDSGYYTSFENENRKTHYKSLSFEEIYTKNENSFSGTIKLVDGNGKEIVAPDGYEKYVEVKENEILVGFTKIGEGKFSKECVDLIQNGYICYIDQSGHSTTFLVF